MYAAVSDLVTRFGQRELIQLTDRSTPPADLVDETVALGALQEASDLIDGYVGAKYALPLATTPPMLLGVCCDVARYKLYADQVPEAVAARYKAALDTLKDIASGRVKIDTAGVEPPSRTEVVDTSGPCRRFDRDRMRGF